MKTIVLVTGEVATVDDEDFEFLAPIRWSLQKSESHPVGYAKGRQRGSRKWYYMHRLVAARAAHIELGSDVVVDHIDFNTLNNCRGNLRIASRAQSQHHKRVPRNNSTGYKGVSYNARRARFEVQVSFHGRKVYHGIFIRLEDAAQVALLKRYQYHGQFCDV